MDDKAFPIMEKQGILTVEVDQVARSMKVKGDDQSFSCVLIANIL